MVCRTFVLYSQTQSLHLDYIFGIAKSLGKTVDVHIDQNNDPDERDSEMLAKKVIEHGMQGKVNAVHCCSLAAQPDDYIKEVIRLIKKAGGIAVFAHPAVSNCDELIPDFMAEGLRGIEAFYPGYNEQQTKNYRALAQKYGLLVTGGSDFHGAGSGREVNLGDVAIPDELVEKLKDEHLRGNKS